MTTLGHGVVDWPKRFVAWMSGRTLLVSIPFTWELLPARRYLESTRMLWDQARVGGPAVDLMPGYFADMERVQAGGSLPGILQRVNPMATRTTTGCVRRCGFCGIGQGLIEGGGHARTS